MTYPRIILPTLEALYRLGNNICAEIEKFQPDVVLGLAHSGWMPVVVAQTLWTETRVKPFPPATRTNIGLEKNEIYVARYGKNTPAFCCGECSDEAGRKGHYLAHRPIHSGKWRTRRIRWAQTKKRKQIHIAVDTIGLVLAAELRQPTTKNVRKSNNWQKLSRK